jgi:hypothetical protein
VREVIREIRTLKSVTNAQLAEAVEGRQWSERRVTDALTENRPLLAAPAYELLMAARSVRSAKMREHDFKTAQIVLTFWSTPSGDTLRTLHTQATIGDPPASAIIPIAEFKRFADEIAWLIFPSPRAAQRRRDAARRIARHLDETNDRRAALWQQAVSRNVYWIVSEIEQGRYDWHFPYVHERCEGKHISASHAAQEGVRFAAGVCCGRPTSKNGS